jgi:hypothetical protein
LHWSEGLQEPWKLLQVQENKASRAAGVLEPDLHRDCRECSSVSLLPAQVSQVCGAGDEFWVLISCRGFRKHCPSVLLLA